MKKAYKALRKVVIGIVGFMVLILGLILIPLPGPGLLVCAAGLFILSLEFDWAERHLNRVRAELKKIVDKAREQKDKTKNT